ncbi:MAG: hypothetical protein HYU37_22200 [Acidobacteria bacterium]|nr:hypothetical protein [Acidobacteriota bacterium]
MRMHHLQTVVIVCAAGCMFAPPALAQQTLNLSLGYFMLRHDRSEADIVLIEHHDLALEPGDFNSVSIGGEFLVPLRETFEVGVGVSYSGRSVSTVHGRVFNPDGSAIRRTLAFAQLPIAATVRWLPLGVAYRVQPYAGGGLALIRFHFRESGDFAARGSLFRDEQYDTSRMAIGTVILAGLRVAGERLVVGMEGRHQRARGSFGPAFARIRDAEIDLHGWTVSGTIGVRLGTP